MRWLTVIIFMPPVIGIIAGTVARVRGTTGYMSARILLLVLLGLILFQTAGYQPKRDDPESLWISESPLTLSREWRLQYEPGADGISLLPAVSAIIITAMAFFARAAGSTSSMVLLLGSLSCALGALFSKDIMLFFIFMESALALNLFSIALKNRNLFGPVRRALIMQSFGAAPMLLALLALHYKGGAAGFMQADIMEAALEYPPKTQVLLLSAFCLTLGFRVPLAPLHGWFMEISDEADPASATTLFGIVSLVAVYGFIRFTLPIFPGVSPVVWHILGIMAALSLIHMGLIAFSRRRPAQILVRTRATITSLAVVGAFSATRPAVAGAVFILITQGLAFASVCMMLDALGKRGNPPPDVIAAKMPRLGTMAFVAILGIIGLPGTAGFVAHILTLGGAFRSQPIIAAAASLGMMTISASLLSLLRRALSQKTKAAPKEVERLGFHESLPPVALLVLIVGLGIFPGVILSRITPSVDRFCEELRHRRTMARMIEQPVRAVEDPFDPGAIKKPSLLEDAP